MGGIGDGLVWVAGSAKHANVCRTFGGVLGL